MLSMEAWAAVRQLHAQGYSVRRISRELHLSRQTVRRALGSPEPPRYQRQPTENQQLAPFVDADQADDDGPTPHRQSDSQRDSRPRVSAAPLRPSTACGPIFVPRSPILGSRSASRPRLSLDSLPGSRGDADLRNLRFIRHLRDFQEMRP